MFPSPLKTAWKDIAWIFLVSRVVIVVLSFLGRSLFSLYRSNVATNCFLQRHECFYTWMRFDVFSYMSIAQSGYIVNTAKSTAFFPLFPTLIRFPAHLFGGSLMAYYLSGLFVSNLCFLCALFVLYVLVEDCFDASIARTAVLYTAFAPFALFYFAGYTESLFLLLSLLVFYFLAQARKGRGLLSWWLAGLAGFLAALSRSQGILLAVPFLLVYLLSFLRDRGFTQTRWREKVFALLPLGLIPLGLGVYMLYLWHAFHNPMEFSYAEAAYWSRSLTSPLVTLVRVVRAIADPAGLQVLNIINLTSLLIPLIMLLVGWKRIPLHYSLFTLILIIFATLYPLGTQDALTAAPRYMLVLFPVTILFASIKNRRYEQLYLAFSFTLFAFNVLLFINHYWVA